MIADETTPEPKSLDPWSKLRYVNLDNAATTPAAPEVLNAVEAVIEVYGSVHRGAGIKSLISTEIYEGALSFVRRFVGARDTDVVVLASNTTTAINRLAASLGFKEDDVVLVSSSEHSSNDLPWRKYSRVVRFPSQSGRVDLEELESMLRQLRPHVRLVAVSGASNVSGYLSPLTDIARLAHYYGAEIFVDAAQLVAHRPIQMRVESEEEDLDYIAFSGHKMYAPFGAGVLVGRRTPFDRQPPDQPGGGTVDMITDDSVLWTDLPAIVTPGTPNVVGLLAVAAAAKMLLDIGFTRILRHEHALVAKGLQTLLAIPELTLYGQGAFRPDEDRLPIFPFTLQGFPHGLVAAMLGREYGIAVRNGHLCQYEFMRRELKVSEESQLRITEQLKAKDKTGMYGMVRASCGLFTSEEDIELLGSALREITRKGPIVDYHQEISSGRFIACDESVLLEKYTPGALRFLIEQR